MSTHEPDNSDGDWVKRYREASDIEAATPRAATREAILAEGRRIAAARAAQPAAHRFDPRQRAANQPRWRLAATGTAGAALLAAILMYPHVPAPPPNLSETAVAPAAAPVPLKPAAPAVDALKNAEPTAARPVPPAALQTPSRKALSVPSHNAASLAFREKSLPQATREAADGSQFGAQAARASAAPAAAAAVGADQRADDSLLSGVAAGDLARLGALLGEGADPQQVDSLGRTPLLLAVIAHREDMVQLLLAHHADPNSADHAGQTPLQRARLDGLSHISRLLEAAGAREPRP